MLHGNKQKEESSNIPKQCLRPTCAFIPEGSDKFFPGISRTKAGLLTYFSFRGLPVLLNSGIKQVAKGFLNEAYSIG